MEIKIGKFENGKDFSLTDERGQLNCLCLEEVCQITQSLSSSFTNIKNREKKFNSDPSSSETYMKQSRSERNCEFLRWILELNTHKVTTRARFPPEQVTPVQELSFGKQGSPLQSWGGLLKLLANSSIAITAKLLKENNRSFVKPRRRIRRTWLLFCFLVLISTQVNVFHIKETENICES